jgi:hypothetical protein
MIILQKDRSLGNALFQYCFARTLAMRFGYELQMLGFSSFPATYSRISGDEILGPISRWKGQWPFDAFSGRRVEPSELYSPPAARLTLSGRFQRFGLFSEHREEIREKWLRTEDCHPMRRIDEFAICLLDENSNSEKKDTAGYSANEAILTELEVRHLAKVIPHRSLYLIVSSAEAAQPFRDLNPNVIEASGIQALCVIQSFRKVAIGQNALEWWGAFLGNAAAVYFPSCTRGIWSHPDPANLADEPDHFGIDLRVDDPRYVYDWA